MRYCDILSTDKMVICEAFGRYKKYRGDEDGINIVYSSEEYNKVESIDERIYRDGYVRDLDGDIAYNRMPNGEDNIAPFYCIIRLDYNPIEMMMKHFKSIKK